MPKLLEIHYTPEEDNDIEILNEIEEVKSEHDPKDEQEQFVINIMIQLTASDQPAINSD